MADQVTAQNNDKPFPTHVEGQFTARCADIVDLGERVEQYPGKPAKLTRKVALVFLTNAPGEVKEISGEFTLSMGEKAGLRQFLESWRGKSYSAEQAATGVPLDKLEGQPGLISVEHKKSAKGNLYAKIKSIAPLPAGLSAPVLNGYARAEFWQGRKKAYADEAAKHKQTLVASSEAPPPEQYDDSEDPLPF